MRHLLTGQDLRQLFRAAGRVLGWDHAQRHAVLVAQHGPQHGNCLRFIVFNTDQHFTRLQNPRQDTNAFDNLRRALLHQAVISRDVRLAFRRVDDQGVDFIAAALQFDAGREACAAQPGHAELVNAFNQLFTRALLVILPAVALNPAVVAVRLDNHAEFRQRGRMSGAVRRNRHHGAGSRRMHRQHSAPAARQRLAA